MKVLYRKEPPFQKDSFRDRCGLLCDLVKAGLTHCFGRHNCITSTVWTEVSSQDEFWTYIANETVDLALPIDPYISSSLAEKLLDSHGDNITLIPVLKSPGFAMVIDYSVCKNRVQQVTINTILSTWPICAVMLLLAGISGIFIWALESRANKYEFPSSFGSGSSEGFWWALVTMTSVGYGDRVPRTIHGRIFSVIWMLIGVCLIAIFTAAVTSAITVSSVGTDCRNTQGKYLGVLNGSEAEKKARHLGAYVTTYQTEDDMFYSLKTGKVEDVMVDRFKAYYYLQTAENDHFRVALQIDYPLDYSVALVGKRFPEITGKKGCLAKYFPSAHNRLDRLIKYYISPVKPLESITDTVGVLSINSPANKQLLIASLVIFLVSLTAGGCWECYRRNRYNLVKFPSRGQMQNLSVNQQLSEIQDALTQISAQVQQLKENVLTDNGTISDPVVSSTNFQYDGAPCFKSLIINAKSKGPNLVPWGTPDGT
ncbi:uncharacterized protein [Acropora muricata]|uniref:uncharacterized protein isoform X2 n=1 Tax=Acropora muricata TaxID=159855 RepID=UPI0034E45044